MGLGSDEAIESNLFEQGYSQSQIEKMRRVGYMKEEDEHENELKYQYYQGSAVMAEALEYQCRYKAGQAYSKGDDTLAKFWREAAIWIGECACEERKQQKQYVKTISFGV